MTFYTEKGTEKGKCRNVKIKRIMYKSENRKV